MIKVKDLERELQAISTFKNPNLLLEQYATSSHLASRMLYVAHTQYGDIENCAIADLGTGCGVLSIGSSLLGATYITGFDIDINVLQQCRDNCKELRISMETVCCDITHSLPDRFDRFFDTVVMNPPFGTKHNKGVDIKFLDIASKMSRNAIYSLHKSSTRTYVLQKGTQLGLKCEVLAELKYDLPNTYKFHKKKCVDINVDFIRFSKK